MKQKAYHFETVWKFHSPIEPVWEILHDVPRWPEWWKDVRDIQILESGLDRGEGQLLAFRWRSVLPYELRFKVRITRIDRPHVLAGHASGELEGDGIWKLEFQHGITTVHYVWKVQTTKLWMNLLSPLAAPLFRWNHNCSMRKGGRALAKMLEGG